MKSAGSAGLVIGVVLLLANNPRRNLPQLSYGRLSRPLVGALACCVAASVALGILGYHGALTWTSADLRMLVHDGLFRPQRFLCVYGIHLGAYVGGVIGAMAGVGWVLRSRVRVRTRER